MAAHGKPIFSGAGLATILLLALASPARSQNNASMPLYQVHGSGTSNPALLIWRVMDVMMARTKPKIAMSYRSIGSGAGGNEFSNSISAFGCGDVPISKINFDQINATMLHVPFLVGSVSIFHNIPGIGEGLFLPPCTLAKIFRGVIGKWNDPEIVGNNTHLPDLKNIDVNINVVHRNNGSSSTYALTHYFDRACPSEWSSLISNTSADFLYQNRSVGVNTVWPTFARFLEGSNSQEIVELLASRPYALGYVESGQGLLAGLPEVAILNANNVTLTSSQAEIASESLIGSQFPLDNLTSSNWTTVNPVYSNASANQWPLILGTYFYVRKDLSYLQEAGGLLKIFLEYMLGDEVTALMPEYSFIALPKTIRANLTATIRQDLVVSTTWKIENGTETGAGQQNFVFSPKRDSYLLKTVSMLTTDSKEAKTTLKLGDAYQVHGSGSFVSALMIRHAMQVLESRARVPISMTYRTVGSVEGQKEFSDYVNMYQSYNHFKVADMPLDSASWTSLNSNGALATIGAVLQLPFAISALGLYHTKSFGRSSMVLNCNLIARLYSGELTSWKDSQLAQLNNIPGERIDVNITVYAMAAPSGSTFALTGYLSKACPGSWTATSVPTVTVTWQAGVTTTFKNESITTPEQMLAAIADTPNSIGYLPVTLGGSSGLMEVQLEVLAANQQDKTRITSKQANLTSIVDQANKPLFSNVSANLAAVFNISDLYGVPGTWPIPIVQYLYMYRNLSGYGYSGPLLRAFVEFLIPGSLTAEGSQLAISSGLTPMPVEVQNTIRTAVAAVTLKTLTVTWNEEAAGLADGDVGAALYTFSANRDSYEAYELQALRSALSEVQSVLRTGLSTVVRVACTPDTFGYIRLLRGDVQDMANRHLRVLDEMGTSAGLLNMLTAALTGTSAAAPTLMVVHPGPLTSDAHRNLSAAAPVVQIPVSIRPVAVLYKGAAGLRLGLCTLAKILDGNITNWSNQEIKDDNPGLNLASSNPITLLVTSSEGGDAGAVLKYIKSGAEAAGCPAYKELATLNLMRLNITTLVDSEALAQLAKSTQYSGLAVLAASGLVTDAARGAGLQAVALRSTQSATFVTPLQTPATVGNSSCANNGCPGLVGEAYTNAVEAALSRPLFAIPIDPSGDWSGFSLIPLIESDLYPVVRFDFLVVPEDMTKFGDDGAAIQGIVNYAISAIMMTRMQEALAPYFCPLGPKILSSEFLQKAAGALIVAPDFLSSWELANSSIHQVNDPSSALVLARAPSVADAALEGSLAASVTTVVASSASPNSSSNISLEVVQTEALKAAKQAAAENQKDLDKLNRTYSIAVAAIVLGLILSLLSLGLALYAVALVRRTAGIGSASAGCFQLGPSKYERQLLDVPVSQVEMRVNP